MSRNMNVPNLWTDTRASVTIEFVFVSIAMLFFILFFADLVKVQSETGKLDRLSYSIAGVLRERVQLFSAREQLNQKDIEQVTSLARRILKDMQFSTDENVNALQVNVQELHFYTSSDIQNNVKSVKLYKQWMSNGGNSQVCHPPDNLNDLSNLSPKGSYGRWVPLYQVTVCMPSSGLFARLFSKEDKSYISSFAIVMLR